MAASKDIRIFLSDIHLGWGKGLRKSKSKHPYDWLGKSGRKEVAGFLSLLCNRTDLKEVVFIGDLFDNWVVPIDEIPPSFDDIMKDPVNKDVKNRINALSKKTLVLYVPGNHDMGVTKEVMKKHFPEVTFGGHAKNDSIFMSSILRAEHGSAHALFNAPDPINDPGNRLPLGYYISRIQATRAQKTGEAKRHYWTYVDDFLELLGPQRVAPSVFEAVYEEADLTLDDVIHMPPVGKHEIKVTIREIKEKYEQVYDQWHKYHNPGSAFKAMMAEIGWLNDAADRLCKKGATRIVVFGHSHGWDLDKDSWFVDDRIYANCGTWCGNGKPYTFVETKKNVKKRKYIVRVWEWLGKKNGIKKLDSTSIEY